MQKYHYFPFFTLYKGGRGQKSPKMVHMVCVRPLGTNFKYLKDAHCLILIDNMQLLSAGLKEVVNLAS